MACQLPEILAQGDAVCLLTAHKQLLSTQAVLGAEELPVTEPAEEGVIEAVPEEKHRLSDPEGHFVDLVH